MTVLIVTAGVAFLVLAAWAGAHCLARLFDDVLEDRER